jgi:hypothetical protein
MAGHGNVADSMGRKVTTVAPVRHGLVAREMLYGPSLGDTAFTMPLFDGFMKRIMIRRILGCAWLILSHGPVNDEDRDGECAVL